MNKTVVAEGLEFPEGPVCLPDGSILVVEVKGGTIARVDPTSGTVERIARTGGGPNGAALGADGRLYVCNNGGFQWREMGGLTIPGHQPVDYIGGRIQVVDIASGKVEDLYTECNGNPLRGPNDLVLDDHGGFYFSDLGKSRERDSDSGVLYYARCDGSSIEEVVFPMVTPNGVGLSPSGDKLYVAESVTSRIWGYTIGSPGKVTGTPMSRECLLYTLVDLRFVDSLAVEESGNVCVATLLTPGITVIAPDGELVEFVEFPDTDPLITNICFGGPDMLTAYVTSAGRGLLYELQWPRPGLRLVGDRV
jgi:gluconolactonase